MAKIQQILKVVEKFAVKLSTIFIKAFEKPIRILRIKEFKHEIYFDKYVLLSAIRLKKKVFLRTINHTFLKCVYSYIIEIKCKKIEM
jgi:hypothetical protein